MTIDIGQNLATTIQVIFVVMAVACTTWIIWRND
jgi:hypothetical protein